MFTTHFGRADARPEVFNMSNIGICHVDKQVSQDHQRIFTERDSRMAQHSAPRTHAILCKLFPVVVTHTSLPPDLSHDRYTDPQRMCSSKGPHK
jgi:hypothetical protein